MRKEGGRILLSGIKPSGGLHIGNYFGALAPLVSLHNSGTFGQSFVFIADLHALTTLHNQSEMRENTLSILAAYLACGLDPKKTVLYKQSDVPEVGELSWIFSCLTTMPYLMRAHAFKDAEAKNKEINVGVFSYPLLMSADILIQKATAVPVGLDQKQHIEIARDTAEKFNRVFGEVFPLPSPIINKAVETVTGTDGRKMSKSYGNTLPLFATDEEIREAVMKIPTSSTKKGEPLDPEKDTVFALHRLFGGSDLARIETDYREGNIGYKESKTCLAERVISFLSPLRARYLEALQDEKKITSILEEGGERARSHAEETMREVRSFIGTSFIPSR